jgi:hypothetical protein
MCDKSNKNLGEMRELLSEANSSFGSEIFLSGSGGFVNRRGEHLNPYDVLKKIEGLRQAVYRAESFSKTLGS